MAKQSKYISLNVWVLLIQIIITSCIDDGNLDFRDRYAPVPR